MASKEDKETPGAAPAEDSAQAAPASPPADEPKAPAKAAKRPKAEKEPKADKAAKPAKAEPEEPAAKAERAEEAAAEKAGKAAKAAKAVKAAKAEPEEPAATAGEARAEGAPAASSADGGQVLKVHDLRPAPGSKKKRTRVGRGEGSKGKTAGRGTKGTKARGQVPARLEGGQMPLHMRLPKLRGFKNPFRTEYQVVNLDKLEALYPEGGEVTSRALVERGVVRGGYPVKVLGGGALTVKLQVRVDATSGAAREKILAAGGSVED